MTTTHTIKHRSELPAWFNLDNYQGCKDFNAQNWLDNLDSRQRMLESIGRAGFQSKLMDVEVSLSAERMFSADLMFVNHFFSISNGDPLHTSKTRSHYRPLSAGKQPVQPLTFYELACLRESDRQHQSRTDTWEALSSYEFNGKTIGEYRKLLDPPVGFIKATLHTPLGETLPKQGHSKASTPPTKPPQMRPMNS